MIGFAVFEFLIIVFLWDIIRTGANDSYKIGYDDGWVEGSEWAEKNPD